MDGRADGTAGSYTLHPHLMKWVYELVDVMDTKTTRQLRMQRDVPMLPLVRTSINTPTGDSDQFLPGVRLAVIGDEEVPLVCKSKGAALCFYQRPFCAWQEILSIVELS